MKYSYLFPWILIDIFWKRRIIPSTPPTLQTLVLEVFLSLIVYDALFFVGHFTMHKIPGLYKHIHARHHNMRGDIKAGGKPKNIFLICMILLYILIYYYMLYLVSNSFS